MAMIDNDFNRQNVTFVIITIFCFPSSVRESAWQFPYFVKIVILTTKINVLIITKCTFLTIIIMAKAGAKPKKKANGYNMPDPLPLGLIIEDLAKQRWKLGPSIGKGGFGEIYSAQKVTEGTKANSKYPFVVKIVRNPSQLYLPFANTQPCFSRNLIPMVRCLSRCIFISEIQNLKTVSGSNSGGQRFYKI